jgi:hypothetical protein
MTNVVTAYVMQHRPSAVFPLCRPVPLNTLKAENCYKRKGINKEIKVTVLVGIKAFLRTSKITV